MGYSATSYRYDEIKIEKADLPAMVESLRQAEAETGGHISWCDPMAIIELRHEGNATTIVKEVLEHYGFDYVEVTEAGDITIGSWGGDKIGSSWVPMWKALATVVKHDVKWVMIGEDNEMWGEAIIPGLGHTSFEINIDLAIDAALKLI
jgi:hypothetical protein